MKTIRFGSARFWNTGGLLLAWTVTVSGLLTTTAQAGGMSAGMEAFPLRAGSRIPLSPIRPWEAASPTPTSMISHSSLVSLRVQKGKLYSFESRHLAAE